jgi:hypothetical protein
MSRHPAPRTSHVWKFFRTGGLDQVALESAEDLLALRELDEKLWVVLSCPVNGLQLDPKTLELVDTDHDGRIHVHEVIAAVEWAAAHLKKPGDLLAPAAALPLAAINDLTPDGKNVFAAAKRILAGVGRADADAITVEDTLDTAKIISAKAPNGDGVVTLRAAADAETQQLIKDVIATVGSVPDRSGEPGINAEKFDAFLAEVKSYLEWLDGTAAHAIPEFGEATAAASLALREVRAKVDDFFARCRLAAFDHRAIAALNRQETEYLGIAARDLSITAEEVAGFPLARVDAGARLPLLENVNPAWAAALARLQRVVITPLFGAARTSLSADEWATVTTRFAAFEAWLGRKPATAVEKLGVERARAILSGPARQKVADLIAQDKALAPEYQAISSVARLTRYYRDLRTLLHNFVNFSDFYSRDRLAIFQAGTLLLDSRACELCLRVDDVGRHADFATKSMAYVAYLDCRRIGGETMKIAACFTQGDSDYLFVGRNGLFYDRQGRDWDATITKIVDNPISIRQAFWTPYKRVASFVEEQFAKFAAAKDKEATADLTGKLSAVPAHPPATGTTAHSFDIAKFAGIFAAITLAVAAISGVVVSIVTGFLHLAPWQMPVAIVGALLIISGPSMLLAALKLRQRNLGPLLEANGWAINGRVKINIPFGAALTERAALPRNARHLLRDPYEESHGMRNSIIIVLVLLALAAAGLGAAYRFHRWPFQPAAKNDAAPAAADVPAPAEKK